MLVLHGRQVRVTVGDSGTCVQSSVSSILLYAHRNNKDCLGREAHDVHLDFHAASDFTDFSDEIIK